MEKRLFLAIAVSLLILLSWSTFVSKTYHIDNKAVITKTAIEQHTPSSPVAMNSLTLPETKPLQPKEVFKFSTGSMEVSFDEQRAAVTEVLF
ncbi:MAG: hypothetical protein WC561_04520, partial [Candidatus Omnitrophota bacterium]